MTDYKILKAIRNGTEYELPGGGGQNIPRCVDVLVVGGGGGGGNTTAWSKSCFNCYGAGGGGGGFVYEEGHSIPSSEICVKIGCGGGSMSRGGCSLFGDIIAYGGGPGAGHDSPANYEVCIIGANGGGPTGIPFSELGIGQGGYCGCGFTGGGAGQNGQSQKGGDGKCSDISGTMQWYAGGGGGYQPTYTGGCGGGGVGGCYGPLGGPGGDATYYGGGGGGAGGSYCCNCSGRSPGGSGYQGIVIVRYPTDGSYGITNAIGGCKYTCGNYTIHCFTNNGFFIPDYKPGAKYISYLVVGGGGGGNKGGGGGGDVCVSNFMELPSSTINISVGASGASNGGNGGNSSITYGNCTIIAQGGCGANGYNGGASGSGRAGGICGRSCGYGGGGGATGIGVSTNNCSIKGDGGSGKCGYGGGGGGGSYCYGNYIGCGCDGGGNGSNISCNGCNATNCGGGGGGAGGRGGVGGTGGCGVVDICYPLNGDFGFTTATGGDSCYTCNGYCVHRFTSNGTFTIVS